MNVRRGRAVLLTGAVILTGAAACSGDDAPATPATAPPATAAATTTTEVPEAGGRIVEDYRPTVGDCFDLRARVDEQGHERVSHLLVDCALPHQDEVFAVVAYPTPTFTPHPGADALRRFARLECPRRFADYVGERYELSRYGLGYQLPTAEQWGPGPVVGCTITGPDGGRTAGSGRATAR